MNNQRRRICAVLPTLELGGAERSLVRTMHYLRSTGGDLDLILFDGSRVSALVEELPSGARVHSLEVRRARDPRLGPKLRLCLQGIRPDLVLGWSLYANLAVSLASLGRRSWGVVLSERVAVQHVGVRSPLSSSGRLTLHGRLMRTLYKTADVLTANSRENLDALKRMVGAGPVYRVLPNPLPLRDELQRKRGPAVEPPDVVGPRLLALGRLAYQKGFDVAIRALARVRKEEPWSLVIVGDGPEREALESLCVKLGISSSVHFLGPTPDPLPYYRWADLVVLPSRFEGFPNVALEAMAVGCAVICCDCRTGPREMLAGGSVGCLVPVEDEVELARSILQLGRENQLREELAEKGRRYVWASYGPETQRTVLEEIMGSALELRNGARLWKNRLLHRNHNARPSR